MSVQTEGDAVLILIKKKWRKKESQQYTLFTLLLFSPDSDALRVHKELPITSDDKISFRHFAVYRGSSVPFYPKVHGTAKQRSSLSFAPIWPARLTGRWQPSSPRLTVADCLHSDSQTEVPCTVWRRRLPRLLGFWRRFDHSFPACVFFLFFFRLH